MYKTFYNLRIDPFKPQTGLASYYQPESLRRLLENLATAIEENHGLFMLTAEDGIGKSSFVDMLLHRLQKNCEYSLVQLDGKETKLLFSRILAGFSIPAKFNSKVEFMLQLTNFLKKIREEGKQALLIVDNAQRLTVPLLDEIRQLINLQQDGSGLISVLLVGESRTVSIVEASLSASFKKKLISQVHVEPLTAPQVEEYIEHRLKTAGCSLKLFDTPTTEYIHSITGGNVKKVNLLCETSLLLGHRRDKKKITESLVREAALQLRMITSQQADMKKQKTAPAAKARNLTPSKKNRSPNRAILITSCFLALAAVLYITQPELRNQVKETAQDLQSNSVKPDQRPDEVKTEPAQVTAPVTVVPQTQTNTDTNEEELSNSPVAQNITSVENSSEVEPEADAAEGSQEANVSINMGQLQIIASEEPQTEPAVTVPTDDETNIATPVVPDEQLAKEEPAGQTDLAQEAPALGDSTKEELPSVQQAIEEKVDVADDEPVVETIQEPIAGENATDGSTTEELTAGTAKEVPSVQEVNEEKVDAAGDKPVVEIIQQPIAGENATDGSTTEELTAGTTEEASSVQQVTEEKVDYASDKPVAEVIQQPIAGENATDGSTTEELTASTTQAPDTTTSDQPQQEPDGIQDSAQTVVQEKPEEPSAVDKERSMQQELLSSSPLFTNGKIILETKPNSSEITDGAAKVLTQFANELKKYPNVRIKIEGYIASLQNSDENIKLSEKRAALVQAQLIKLGVDEANMAVEGMGNQHPIGNNETADGRRKNRRVEISVLKEDGDQ